MGELRKIYSLASVVFVGRSLVDLGARQHGSDMIEPCALGKATIVGPFTGNFADAVRSFTASQAIVEVPDEPTLAATLTALLLNPNEAKALLDLGILYQSIGNRERSLQYLELFLIKAPKGQFADQLLARSQGPLSNHSQE